MVLRRLVVCRLVGRRFVLRRLRSDDSLSDDSLSIGFPLSTEGTDGCHRVATTPRSQAGSRRLDEPRQESTGIERNRRALSKPDQALRIAKRDEQTRDRIRIPQGGGRRRRRRLPLRTLRDLGCQRRKCGRAGVCARQPLAVLTASVSFGTTSKRSPTTPRFATSKIGASGSLLIAMMKFDDFMPTRCWIAPEMPHAT